MSRRTTDLAHHALKLAHHIAEHIDATQTAIHDSRGGYPASTPGAAPATPSQPAEYGGTCQENDCPHGRPCPDHDTPITLTQPERNATTVDWAALDAIKLTRALRRAFHHLAIADDITNRWKPAIDTTTVGKKLAAADKSLWCRNCATHGVNNVSEENRADCRFCATFRRTWGTPPNRAILDIHGHRAVTPQDAVRILDRDVPGWRKTMPKPKTPKTKTKNRAA